MSIFKPQETQFFIDVITTTLQDRKAKGGSTRNDLIDLMLKAMKDEIGEIDAEETKEQFDLDSELKHQLKGKKKELEEITIVATAMLMLIAGHEYNQIFLQVFQIKLFNKKKIFKLLLEIIFGQGINIKGKCGLENV